MVVDVLVPPVGQTVDTMTLLSWYKKEGEPVTAGEPLFVLETDKASLDVEAPASGFLCAVAAQPGDEVKALSRLAVIAEPNEQVPTAVPSVAALVPSAASPTKPGAGRVQPGQRIFVSPRARRLAETEHVELARVIGTGPQGAVVERDVQAYLAQPPVPGVSRGEPEITPLARRVAEGAGLEWRHLSGTGPAGKVVKADVVQAMQAPPAQPLSLPTAVSAAQPGEQDVAQAIPVTGMRRIIAQRMFQSHSQTAAVTLAAEADATAVVELRAQLKRDGVDVSYNDLFVFILARALREHPRVNASLQGDAIRLWRDVHIGVAVDTDRGLLVPVLHDVDAKGLVQISQESRALIDRAQHGQCTPEELGGGRFTLTNLGMFGIDVFTPIINLPECAILGVGQIKMQPVMVEGVVVGRQMVWLSLTFDHRLVDGAPAARFLQRVVQLAGHPHLLLA